MANAVPKEGLRAPLFFLAITASVLLPSGVFAQTVDRADLELCAALPTTDTKLSCFEALARGEVWSAGVEQQAEPDADSISAGTAAGAATAAAVAVGQQETDTEMAERADTAQTFEAEPSDSGDDTTVASAEDGLTPSDNPEDAARQTELDRNAESLARAEEERNAAAVASVAASESALLEQSDADLAAAVSAAEAHAATVAEQQAAAAAVAADSSLPDSYGAEYLDADGRSGGDSADNKKEVVATVERVRLGYDRRIFFYFDNGQVWRQSTADYISYPKNEAFEAEISRGMMGDYRLRVGGKGRMTRIVRVK